MDFLVQSDRCSEPVRASADAWCEFDDAFWQCVHEISPGDRFLHKLADYLQVASDQSSSDDDNDSTAGPSRAPTPKDGVAPLPTGQAYPREQCVNWGDPDAETVYLMSAAPPRESSYGGKPASEPRALTRPLYEALQDAYQAKHPDVLYHELHIKTPKNLPRPDRARVQLHTKQLEAAFLRQLGSECPARSACKLRTWADFKIYWAKKCTTPLTTYMQEEPDEKKKAYKPPAPIEYKPELAMSVTYLTVNIEYNGTTYCIACRHATYRFDVHFWCMRCTLLAGYWPCTALEGHAVCDRCKRMPSSARTQAMKLWNRLYKEDKLQLDAVITFTARLPANVATQFDANVMQVLLARNRGAAGVTPLDPDFEKEQALAKSYNMTLTAPSTSADSDGKTPGGRRGKRRTQQPDRLDPSHLKDRSLKETLKQSRHDTGGAGAGKSTDTTGDTAGPDGGRPAKRTHHENEDYDALTLPWDYICSVLRGVLHLTHAAFTDDTGTRRGFKPSTATPPDVYNEMRLVWAGTLHVKVIYPHDAVPAGSWCLLLCAEDEQGACEAPYLPCPTKDTVVKPPPRPLTFHPPQRYHTVMNTGTINWPAILQCRFEASYKPTFAQLENPDSWFTTFPPMPDAPNYTAVPRRNVVLPTRDKTYTWEEVAAMTRENLLELIKADANVEASVLTTRAFTHDWWRQCSTPGRLVCDLSMEGTNIICPLLTPYSSATDPTIHKNATRPEVPDAPDVPHLIQAFGSLSVTAKAYVQAREQEQVEFILSTTRREDLLQTTYRSRRMRVPVAQYQGHSDIMFPVTSLPIPSAVAWQPRLATPIDSFTSYPVTDIAMRYIEELARAHMYQTSHRENALNFIDRDLHDLLQIVTLITPTYRQEAKTIVQNTLGRLWNLLLDDVALTADLVMTVVHARRQGFLSLHTSHMTEGEVRAALNQPLINATNLLEPPDIKPPTGPAAGAGAGT